MISNRKTKVLCVAVLLLAANNNGFSQGRKQQEEKALMQETMVWMGDEQGMENHRILGLTQGKNGAILAFTEARVDGSDEGPHDLVCKRSTDGGATWSSTIYIEKSDGRFWKSQGVIGKMEAWANPAALLDRSNGRIFIFYVLNEGEHQGLNTQRMTRVFYRYSDDEGLTWSKRTEITAVLNVDPKGEPHLDIDGQPIENEDGFAADYLGRAFHMPGPGHGIQLENGRLLVPFWHRRALGRKKPDGTVQKVPVSGRLYSSSVIYSDDHGLTWEKGMDTGLGHRTTEARIVELAGGTVMMNARMHNQSRRWVAISDDQGRSWKGHEEHTVMPYTSVDCGLIRIHPPHLKNEEENGLIHSHPNKEKERAGLTVSLSTDGGKTWPISKLVYGYGALYSDLVQLNDGAIGLLYEKKNNHPGSDLQSGISFVRFELEWLAEKME